MTYKEIFELTQWLEQSAFTSYSLSVNGVSLSVSKQPQGVDTAPLVAPAPMAMPIPSAAPVLAPVPTPAPTPEDTGHLIRSPIVGTYYASQSPETPPLATIGQKVKKGDVLCILEAMKVMNEITADIDGTIGEIYATNGEMVEARMPLFKVV